MAGADRELVLHLVLPTGGLPPGRCGAGNNRAGQRSRRGRRRQCYRLSSVFVLRAPVALRDWHPRPHLGVPERPGRGARSRGGWQALRADPGRPGRAQRIAVVSHGSRPGRHVDRRPVAQQGADLCQRNRLAGSDPHAGVASDRRFGGRPHLRDGFALHHGQPRAGGLRPQRGERRAVADVGDLRHRLDRGVELSSTGHPRPGRPAPRSAGGGRHHHRHAGSQRVLPAGQVEPGGRALWRNRNHHRHPGVVLLPRQGGSTFDRDQRRRLRTLRQCVGSLLLLFRCYGSCPPSPAGSASSSISSKRPRRGELDGWSGGLLCMALQSHPLSMCAEGGGVPCPIVRSSRSI